MGLGKGRGAASGAGAEHDDFGERIGAEAIGAVDRDAGAFAGGEQAGQGRRGVDIGVNAAHGVVHHRPHRDQLVHRIDADIGFGQFAHHRQPLVDLLLPEMADVEMHHVALRRLDGAALLLLVPERLAQAVARPELHRLLARPGVGRAEIVVLQIAVAVLVDEDAAFAARIPR